MTAVVAAGGLVLLAVVQVLAADVRAGRHTATLRFLGLVPADRPSTPARRGPTRGLTPARGYPRAPVRLGGIDAHPAR